MTNQMFRRQVAKFSDSIIPPSLPLSLLTPSTIQMGPMASSVAGIPGAGGEGGREGGRAGGGGTGRSALGGDAVEGGRAGGGGAV